MAIYPDKKGRGKPTGRYRVEVQMGGRRLRGRFDTFTEAQEEERKFRQQLASGDTAGATQRDDTRGAPKTLTQLLDKAAPLLWNGSAHGMDAEGKVRRIATQLEDRRLEVLDTSFVDGVVLWLRAEGRAPGTINRYLSALHRVLSWGHAQGRAYVARMPEFSWQDEDEGRLRWLSPAEEKTLCDTLCAFGWPEMADFVTAALDTGCRRTELGSAIPEQLDGPWLRLWITKNGEPRSVPLTPRTQAILKRRLPWSFSDSQLRYWFDKAKEAMGLADDEDFVVHALRHTTATRLVARNVNLRVVQKFMGHKSIQTTLRYAHVSDELLADAATKLSQADYIRLRDTVGALVEGDGQVAASDAQPRLAGPSRSLPSA